MGQAKVLVVGAIQGRLRKAFEKISKLHAKQDFALALVVGDVFGEDDDAQGELNDLLTGAISVPLTTYFGIGDSSLPQKVIDRLELSEDVCPNLIYLGRKGTFTTADGIRIVSLGGKLIENEASVTATLGKYDPLFLDSEARALHGAHSAHVLLTNQWPANIHRMSKFDLPEGIDKYVGVQSIANLCLALKPWYHFSSSPTAGWEREPFRQPDEYGSLDQARVTRFKSAASVAGPNKEWMTAFSINTDNPPAAQQSTEAPFLRGSPPRKRAAEDNHSESYSRYGRGDYNGRHGRSNKRARQIDPNDCFMCLNKPEFKTHMVVSIGDESMVTTSRGPLPLPSTFPQLSFSGHVMIVPHYHAADELAQGKRPAEEVKAEFEEMNKFRKALSVMIGTVSEGKLGTVCWEVNRIGIRHFHWQLIAAHADQIRKGLIEAAFKIAGENNKHSAFTSCDGDAQLDQRSDYFRVWTWTPSSDAIERADKQANGEHDRGATKSMYFPLSPNEKFNVWFGREVMAGILQLEDRINWKAALHPNASEEERIEEQEAAALKEDFADYDFAMQ